MARRSHFFAYVRPSKVRLGAGKSLSVHFLQRLENCKDRVKALEP
jgi:hypothetical protein